MPTFVTKSNINISCSLQSIPNLWTRVVHVTIFDWYNNRFFLLFYETHLDHIRFWFGLIDRLKFRALYRLSNSYSILLHKIEEKRLPLSIVFIPWIDSVCSKLCKFPFEYKVLFPNGIWECNSLESSTADGKCYVVLW